MNKAIKTAMEVPGQFSNDEAEFLYKLATRKGNIVEIGALFGRSTAVLVQAASVYNAHLTTIDPFYKTPNTDLISSPEFWKANLKKVGLEPPELLHMESHEASKIYNKEVSLVFIDGGHNYETVKQDIEDWAPKVKATGSIVFHDMYMPHINGVAKAVNEWWLNEFESRTWRFEGIVHYTIAFRRTK